jgi:hypothetical protein
MVENKRAVVEFFYEKENADFHLNTHKNGGTVQENVNSTVGTISENSEMYEVDCNGELAAFFVKYEDVNGFALEGFHVGKEFRTSDFLHEFWKVVKVKMQHSFYTGIYERNDVALKHLVKQGFELVGTTLDKEQKVFILKLNL